MRTGIRMHALRLVVQALRARYPLHGRTGRWLRRLWRPGVQFLCRPGVHHLRGAGGCVRLVWHRLPKPLW